MRIIPRQKKNVRSNAESTKRDIAVGCKCWIFSAEVGGLVPVLVTHPLHTGSWGRRGGAGIAVGSRYCEIQYGYRSWARWYHSAYEYVETTSFMLESWPMGCVASGPAPLLMRCILKSIRCNHIPPFFRRSSARAFLAASTNGASVFKGSAVVMKGCYDMVSWNL